LSRNSKFTQENRLQILALIEEGYSVTDAAAKFKVGQCTIRRWRVKFNALGPEALSSQPKNNRYPVELKTQAVAKITRQAHYKYLKREPSGRELTNKVIVDTIASIYLDVDGIYGYRMMQLAVNQELQASYNPKRIYRLMRFMGLKSVTRKKRKQNVKSTSITTTAKRLI